MKRFVVLLVASLFAAFPATAGATERTPDLFTAVLSEAGLKCAAKEGRTILCIVHATDSEADKAATGIVEAARGQGFGLEGWTLMLVTSSDYVVSLPFQN